MRPNLCNAGLWTLEQGVRLVERPPAWQSRLAAASYGGRRGRTACARPHTAHSRSLPRPWTVCQRPTPAPASITPRYKGGVGRDSRSRNATAAPRAAAAAAEVEQRVDLGHPLRQGQAVAAHRPARRPRAGRRSRRRSAWPGRGRARTSATPGSTGTGPAAAAAATASASTTRKLRDAGAVAALSVRCSVGGRPAKDSCGWTYQPRAASRRRA